MPDAVKSIAVVLAATATTVGDSVLASADVLTNVPDSQLNSASISWSSNNPAVATITATSLGCTVTAVSPGTVQIRAAIGSVQGSATLTVVAPAIEITALQETQLKAVPVGGAFVLRGPTTEFPARKDA